MHTVYEQSYQLYNRISNDNSGKLNSMTKVHSVIVRRKFKYTHGGTPSLSVPPPLPLEVGPLYYSYEAGKKSQPKLVATILLIFPTIYCPIFKDTQFDI